MALILNKTLEGTISVDESGNTLETGYPYSQYIDKYGNVLENPYMVIDEFIINKNNKLAKIYVRIYKDKDSRINKRESLELIILDVSNEMFDKYFSMDVLDSGNVYKSAYKYVTERKFVGWMSDE